MDRLRQLIANISAQLGVLSLSQRIAIGLCAALIVTSLLWLMQWSTSPQYVPLVDHEFTLEEISDAEKALRGHDFETRGNTIFVRPGERDNLVRVLHEAGALPEGSLYTMENMMTESNPFISPDELRERQNYAKGNSLASIIQTSPLVRSARVLLNPKTKRRLGGQSDVPTASVTVELEANREMSMQNVDSFAKLVSGAVQGLKPWNVYVTDSRTMRTYNPPHPDDSLGLGYLEEVKKREMHLQGKILSLLAYIPGVLADVSVELDGDRRVVKNIVHDKPTIKLDKSKTQDTNSGASPGESGLQPNVGTGLTANAAGKSQSTEEKTSEFNAPAVKKEEHIETMPYAVKRAKATVSIPRSFIVGLYRAQNPDNENPTDQEIATEQATEVAKVKQSVERIIMATSEADVYVFVQPDMQWTSAGGTYSTVPGGVAATAESASTDVVGMLRGYGPQAGLGLLAIMSLFMMMRVVRKSADVVPPMPPKSGEEEETDAFGRVLSVGPYSVGDAEVGDGFLTGREVDEDTLMSQQLNEEVSRLVEADPAGAANLLRRWVEESD